MALSDGTAPHTVVGQYGASRIVCMDSMGHVDYRLSPSDVVVAGSHSAVCAVRLLVHLRLRGVIGHAAGPGLRAGGVSGLAVLAAAGVPAAAVSGETAPIADGVKMYEDGVICEVNAAAQAIGVDVGMTTKRAAELMATQQLGPFQLEKVQHVVYDGPLGKVVALDTIAHGDERINGTVLCMGSHSGRSMADYLEPYQVIGTITNDVGKPVDRSGVKGMDRLAERGIPSAVVDVGTAEVGDGRSTYHTGIVSDMNSIAEELGITIGMPAAAAAELMLKARRIPA